MEAVDVLGDHRLQLSCLLQLGQLFVGVVGPGLKGEHLIPIEAEESLRAAHKVGVTQNRLRRLAVFLVIQSVHAAEVRHAALSGDACPAKKDNILALVDPLLQLFQFFHRKRPFLKFYKFLNNPFIGLTKVLLVVKIIMNHFSTTFNH